MLYGFIVSDFVCMVVVHGMRSRDSVCTCVTQCVVLGVDCPFSRFLLLFLFNFVDSGVVLLFSLFIFFFRALQFCGRR